MRMRYQDPDDLSCKPVRFLQWQDDQDCVKTFEIRGPWKVSGARRLGNLIVAEGPDGPLLAITLDGE
jgi:hypothetical protein